MPKKKPMSVGSSRLSIACSRDVEPVGHDLAPLRLEARDQEAHGEEDQDHGLDEVHRLEAPEQLRLLREVRGDGEELLADQGVVAGDDEERELVDVAGPGDLDGAREE